MSDVDDYIHCKLLRRAVPTYGEPYMYKRDSEGEVLLARGDEYYDDSIPYDGVYIHFAKQIMEASSRIDVRSSKDAKIERFRNHY